MKLSYFAGAIGALALAASTAQAQSKLTTLFASNNGGSTGGIVYFDVTVKAGVIISAFETNVDVAASTSIGLDVYTCPTTYVGNEGNQAAWTQVATDNGQAVSAGSGDVASLVTLQTPLTLTPGTYGMALIAKNFGHDYTNGSGTNQSYQDNFLKLDLGAAYNSPWGASPFSPRVWNGSVIYNPAAGIFANFSATPVEGKSPLQVQFTDATFTDDPNGVSKWEWDFNNDQIVDSTMQNPTFVFTGVGYDVKYTVSLKATDVKNGSSTETKKDFIVVNPFPVASATSFGQGSTVPAGVPGPMQMPAFASTYSYVTDVRGFFAQAPTTFAITSFNVPNEAQATDQSVWFFTFPGTTAPSSYAVTAADTKFVGSGPVTAPLTPTTPIVIQQGTWFGVLGCCHDSVGTTQHNSYGNGGFTTTILGAPTVVNRLYHSGTMIGHPGTGTVYTSTGSIGRVELGIPGNLQSTIPVLAASGDTPYFGANPQLDMTASIPGAQVGILGMSLVQLPVSVPTPFGGLLVAPNFALQLAVAGGTGSVQLPIPNDPNLADLHLYWQGIVFDIQNQVYGMTNGIDWHIGQQ